MRWPSVDLFSSSQTEDETRWSREVEALREVIEKLTHTNMALQIELARYRVDDVYRSKNSNSLDNNMDDVS